MKNADPNASCPVCSKPLAGRGKYKSYFHADIGPRQVGTIWQEEILGRKVGPRVEVVALNATGEGVPSWMGWSITERDLEGDDAGRLRTHCTAWRPRSVVVGFSLI
jgi:hypothetical protein